MSWLDTALIYCIERWNLFFFAACASKHSTRLSLRSTIPEDWDKHFEVEISKEKAGSDRKGLVCSRCHCKHNPRFKDYTVFRFVCVWVCLDAHVCTFVCAHMCLSFYRHLAHFSLIVLWVPHWGGRRGRLTMFPVGEALMLSPRGNAVQSHFPFICCVSFSMYNHLQSHQALHAVRCLHLETSVML